MAERQHKSPQTRQGIHPRHHHTSPVTIDIARTQNNLAGTDLASKTEIYRRTPTQGQMKHHKPHEEQREVTVSIAIAYHYHHQSLCSRNRP
jgi:hypothetical protein